MSDEHLLADQLLAAVNNLSVKVDSLKEGHHQTQLAYTTQTAEFRNMIMVVGELSTKVATMEAKIGDRRVDDTRRDGRIAAVEGDMVDAKKLLRSVELVIQRNEAQRGVVGWAIKNWGSMTAIGVALYAYFSAKG